MTTKQNIDKLYSNDTTEHLLRLGWTSHFQTQLDNFFNDQLVTARVVGVRKNNFRISNGKKEWLATAAGRFGHRSDGLYPVTGDWVLVADTAIAQSFGQFAHKSKHTATSYVGGGRGG